MENPESGLQVYAAELLIDLWFLDRELGNKVAKFSWMADGWRREMPRFLRILGEIASHDIDLARMAVNLPWSADRLTPSDANSLNVLYELSLQDRELARTMLQLPWVVNGVNDAERAALYNLAVIAAQDPELARTAAGLPWVVDGLDSDGDEVKALGRLRNISATDTSLGRTAMNLPWIADGVADLTGDPSSIASAEVAFLGYLDGIATTDLELAMTAVSLPWFGHEYYASRDLYDIVEIDPKLARVILSLPRFIDGITQIEEFALSDLLEISRLDIDAALYSAKNVGAHAGDFDLHFISSIFDIMNDDPGLERWGRLTSQPWFADGLDHEEAALITVLGDGLAAGDIPEITDRTQLFLDFLQTHVTQAKTVSLPLAGEVNIWVFRVTPFPPDEDVPGNIEYTARLLEEFTGLPFPVSDIILLVDGSIDRGGYYGSSMILGQAYLSSVVHETAHYYFSYSLIDGPVWLVEGGAEFIVALVKEQMGKESLEQRKADLLDPRFVYAYCINTYENLWGLHSVRSTDLLEAFEACPYNMGEYFLLEVYKTIGREAMASAIREMSERLYLPDSESFPYRDDRELREARERVREEEIYRILLKHTPADRQEELRKLYRTLHGGPFVEPADGG